MRAPAGKREQELQRFRNAMDSTRQAILLVDRATMRFVDVNASASKLLGYTREELLEIGPAQVSTAPSDYHESDYDQLIAGVGDFGLRQAQLRRKDGSLVLVEIHREASRTDSGWLMLEVVRDLTSGR